LSETRRLRHAQTLAVVLLFANWTGFITRSPELGRYAEELLAISTAHRLPYHFGWATASHGALLTSLGQAHEGLTLLTQGLEALRATGALVNTSTGAYVARQGLRYGRAAFQWTELPRRDAQIIETTDERYCEAELHRLRAIC
jgi:hypothetical protein